MSRLLHTEDHIGRADAGAFDASEGAQRLDGGIGGHRRHYAVGAQKLCRQQPDDIAAHEIALSVDQQWAVAVTVGGDDGIEPMRLDPAVPRLVDRIRKGFGVDRHEGLAPLEPHHFCPGAIEQRGQMVAGHRRMLEHADGPARQGGRRKEMLVAPTVAIAGGSKAVLGRRVAIGRHRIHQRAENAQFVFLGDLALRRAALGHGMQRQRRRRQHPAIDGHEPCRAHGRRAIGGNRPAAGPQIARDEDATVAADLALAEMPEERRDVAARRVALQFQRQPAQPAGAEFEAVRHVPCPHLAIRPNL